MVPSRARTNTDTLCRLQQRTYASGAAAGRITPEQFTEKAWEVEPDSVLVIIVIILFLGDRAAKRTPLHLGCWRASSGDWGFRQGFGVGSVQVRAAIVVRLATPVNIGLSAKIGFGQGDEEVSGDPCHGLRLRLGWLHRGDGSSTKAGHHNSAVMVAAIPGDCGGGAVCGGGQAAGGGAGPPGQGAAGAAQWPRPSHHRQGGMTLLQDSIQITNRAAGAVMVWLGVSSAAS